ncbi:MAG: MGMT family protein [Candidatus Acidiferrales bacterium]
MQENVKLARVSGGTSGRALRRALRYTSLSRPQKTWLADQSERIAMSWDPVYQLIKTIPRGQVTTYGLLARALKIRGGARTVGHAMAATPSGQGVPWHRVVAAGGRLIIREPIGSKQRKLLESEGVPMRHGRVEISTCLWTPVSARAKRGKKASPKARNKSNPVRRKPRAQGGNQQHPPHSAKKPLAKVARPVPRVI